MWRPVHRLWSSDKPPCLLLSSRRRLRVVVRVVLRSVIVSTISRKKFIDEELVAMVLEHHDVDSLYGFSSVDSSLDSSFESETHTSCNPHITQTYLPASRFHQLQHHIHSAAPCILQLYLQNYLYLDNRSFYSIKQCMHGFLRTCSVYVAQQKYKICIYMSAACS